MGREEKIKRIIDLMSLWVNKIDSYNYVDFFDINRVAEDLALMLLNEIYNYELVNLNDEKSNYPGIDLGDKINKIAFQVTSRCDDLKIYKNLETFVKHDKKIYSNGIRFFILNKNKPKLTGKKWQEIDADFKPKEHIITHNDLIKKIEKLYESDRSRFDRVKTILEEEIAVKGLNDGKVKVKSKQIKILSITASPDDIDDFFYEQEQDTMLHAFKDFDRDQVFLEMPDPVKSTIDEIKERLVDGKHDILHITAHGDINDKGEGFLCFEDHHGQNEKVTGSELAKMLNGLDPAPVMVILSSCHSARKEPDLTPTARALYDSGVAAVIGMNKSISHSAAIEFNVAFFNALAGKKTIKEAFDAGKEAIFNGELRRIKENPNWGALKEYEIPQLLARDENMSAESFSEYRIEAPGRPQSHHFQGARYLERGFIGRRQVLREIFNAIGNKQGAVVLKGPGGIGKSTLTTRIAANLLREGYDFIVIRGATSEVNILDAISTKAAERGVENAKEVYAANADTVQKLGWFVENFLLPHKVMIILDNFEENQDEERGDFLDGKETLKEFLWGFRDYLKNKDSFLFFSTRYTLPGFEEPDITKNISEFTEVEFRKMVWNGKSLKRLDGKSIKTLQMEIGGNPRALDLLDRIAFTEFNEREYKWEELKDLIPELRRRIIEKKSANDDFTPLFLDQLIKYLTPEQRLIVDALSIYRNPVAKEGVTALGEVMARDDRSRLADLSLIECIEIEKVQYYYAHRLTAQYVLDFMEKDVKTRFNVQAAQYFAGIRDEKGEYYLEYFIEARWHYMQAGEWDKAAEITFDLERYLTLHGYPQYSMELLRKLDIEKLNETNRLVTLGKIGSLYQDFGEYDKSIEFLQKAYEIAQRNNDLKNSSASLHNIGAIYQEKGDYDSALAQYEKAKEIFEKIGDIKGVSTSLHQIGIIYQYKGDYDSALAQYEKAKEIFEKVGDSKSISASLHQIGNVYFLKGEYDLALNQYRLSLMIREKIGDIKGQAGSLHQIGMIYQFKGDYDLALAQYRQSLEIREKIVDIKGQAESLSQIGIIYQIKGEYDSALTRYRQSLEIAEKIGDIKGVSANLHQIGIIYQEKGDYNSALVQYKKAKETFEKIGDIKSVSASLHQIGRIYEEKGDYDSALAQFRQSLEIAEKIGDIAGVAGSMGQIGILYAGKNEYETALRFFVQAFLIFDKIGSPNANGAKHNIALVRKKIPEERFNEILKEFSLVEDTGNLKLY